MCKSPSESRLTARFFSPGFRSHFLPFLPFVPPPSTTHPSSPLFFHQADVFQCARSVLLRFPRASFFKIHLSLKASRLTPLRLMGPHEFPNSSQRAAFCGKEKETGPTGRPWDYWDNKKKTCFVSWMGCRSDSSSRISTELWIITRDLHIRDPDSWWCHSHHHEVILLSKNVMEIFFIIRKCLKKNSDKISETSNLFFMSPSKNCSFFSKQRHDRTTRGRSTWRLICYVVPRDTICRTQNNECKVTHWEINSVT